MMPSAPQYTPRALPSSLAIASIALRLGAPVMEPQGNSACIRDCRPISGRVMACTVLVICQSVG